MGRRWVLVVLLLLLAFPALAADSSDKAEGPKLRRWHLGLQGVSTWRDRYDVFGLPDTPPGEVSTYGHGAGLFFGARLGDRFLLDLQLCYAEHGLAGASEKLGDLEFLVTGTVLFRHTSTLQPFLRGGFGGGGLVMTFTDDPGNLFAFGTVAIAGGGTQVRLSNRFSLDLELVSTFTNFLEVLDETEGHLYPEESWQVRKSNWGMRLGVGLVFWF
jgi:hypothetical protein